MLPAPPVSLPPTVMVLPLGRETLHTLPFRVLPVIFAPPETITVLPLPTVTPPLFPVIVPPYILKLPLLERPLTTCTPSWTLSLRADEFATIVSNCMWGLF